MQDANILQGRRYPEDKKRTTALHYFLYEHIRRYNMGTYNPPYYSRQG